MIEFSESSGAFTWKTGFENSYAQVSEIARYIITLVILYGCLSDANPFGNKEYQCAT
jgi:hypothetical protein